MKEIIIHIEESHVVHNVDKDVEFPVLVECKTIGQRDKEEKYIIALPHHTIKDIISAYIKII